MKLNTLQDLLIEELHDIYDAENQILKALPKMSKAASAPELKQAFDQHLKQTQTHVERLDRVFQQFGQKPKGKTCPAILGILEEGEEIIKEYKGSPALDAGLIAAAQAVEHYEITRYGTLLAWAKQLGLGEAEGLIKETLVEEENTDELLSELAEEAVNPAAA